MRNNDLRKNVYLTGFMGSGKSTLGKIVANVIGYSFVDLDEVLVEGLGMPIADYFAKFGEASFRIAEAEALLETQKASKTLFALGGGTIAQPDNLDFVLKNGIGVYLRLLPETLNERLQFAVDRPLLLDDAGNRLSDAERLARIRRLLAQRENYYHAMPIILDGDGLDVGQTVDILVKRLQKG